MSMKYLFFVLEGSDGSGKATQVKLLESYLSKTGHNILHQEFPRYSKKAAYLAQEYLKGTYGKPPGKIATLFYAVDRYDALKTEIEPFISKYAQNKSAPIVVADRWVTASKGHQVGKGKTQQERDEILSFINYIEHEIMQLPKATVTIFLDIHPLISQILGTNNKNPDIKGKDLHVSDIEHLMQTRLAYLEVAKIEGWKIVRVMKKEVEKYTNKEVLEGEISTLMRTREEIHEEIIKIVQPYLTSNN